MTDKLVDIPLKENRNEILVASTKDEVCFRVHYSHKIMFITGKIYTFKAKGIFKDINKEPYPDYEPEITNGILGQLNAIGRIHDKNEDGYYCLQNPGLKIFHSNDMAF